MLVAAMQFVFFTSACIRLRQKEVKEEGILITEFRTGSDFTNFSKSMLGLHLRIPGASWLGPPHAVTSDAHYMSHRAEREARV